VLYVDKQISMIEIKILKKITKIYIIIQSAFKIKKKVDVANTPT
jgi:hypothetical protein